MKKIILLLFIFFYEGSFAQKFSVTNESQNIAYLGFINPFSIVVENVSASSLIVKTNNGELVGENGTYDYRPARIGPAVITIYTKKKGKLKEIGKKDFRIKGIWDPVFKIGSGKDSMSKKELLTQQYVRAELENSDYSMNFQIESFTVCIISKDTCKYIEWTNKGFKISDVIRTAFQTLRPNDTIVFKEIICTAPEGKRKIEPKLVTVTE